MFELRTYFSNRVEQLYEFFKKELYYTNNHPFAERLIVVPSPAVKNWLTLRLADDPKFGIAMGIKMGFLDQTLKEVSIHSKIQPSRQAVSFTIEALLDKRWKKGELETNLQRYLGDPFSRRGQSRLVQMADALSVLFERYGIYGAEMVKEWEKNPSKHWQAELWHELFSGDWSYPAAIYNEKQPNIKPNTSIHLFSISYISPVHHRYLEQLSKQVPVSYYILSPCQTFWSDVLTDREAGRLEAYWRRRGVAEGEQQALEEYLSDRNPLLANYGYLGRSMSRLLEQSDVAVASKYVYSSAIEQDYQDYLLDDTILIESKHNLTLLEGIQADIGLMRNPADGGMPEITANDDSIQVHAAPTMLREVEVVRDLILRAVEAKTLVPEEVLVMAPDISSYASVIECVFGHPESPVDYQLLDVGKIAGNKEIQLLMEFLNLSTSRWDVVSIISLMENGVGFSKENAESIIHWLRKAEVNWGYNTADRQELLSRDHGTCQLVDGRNRGTWSDAISRLVRGMVIEAEHEFDASLDLVSTSEGELLGKFITFLNDIRQDLVPLNNEKKTVPDWIVELEKIINKYLTISDETQEYLFSILEEIRRASLRMGACKVPFYSLKYRLQKAFEKKESGYRETHLSAVRFCSMLPMRAIPAKMIILMGMDEHSFPKKDRPSNLDQMRFNRTICDETPSQIDYDRFLFLESILSARHTLIMTYVSGSIKDPKEQSPSVVVTELVDYVEKAFCVTIKTIKHPFSSFHHSLFNEESPLRNYSQRDFKMADIFYNRDMKIKAQPFSIAKSLERDIFIDVDHFQKCIKNPLRNYLRSGLQLKIPKQKESMSEEEAFEFDGLKTHQLTKMSLKCDPEQLYKLIQEHELLPNGVFGDVAKKEIEHEILSIQKNKKTLGLGNDSFFDLVFTEEVKKPKKENGQWMLPPLPFGAGICFTGMLRDCTDKGIWIHKNLDHGGIGDSIGKYLVFMSAVKHFQLPFDAHVLFGKSGVRKAFDENQFHTHVESVNKIFIHSQKEPCYLYVDWIKPILEKKPEELSKSISNSHQRCFDEYTSWFLHNRTMPSSEEIIEKWHGDAEAIYGLSYQSWTMKKDADAEL